MVFDQRQGNLRDAIKRFYSKPAVLPRLILANLIVFVIIYVVNLISWLFQTSDPGSQNILIEWLAVPSEPVRLFHKPWTIITYMFLHLAPLHLIFNMWMLYFGGQLFRHYLSDRQLLATYFYGGFSGALLYIVAYNVFPVFLSANPFAVALGASASVLAIIVGIAAWVPNYPVNLLLFGPVRIKYIAVALVIIDFFSIQGSNPGGHIAHIGGAFWGVLYAFMMRKGYDPSVVFDLLKLRRSRARFKVSSRGHGSRPETDEQYNMRRLAEQQQIDKILDKIARSGYESLNSSEKEILFKSSNRKN
jgi:membrane associated rhomboid family serine protease